ncbi:MAG: hypothetical protein Q8R70_11570, partial [Methanoregula sp.]|nr:hypothetical protein [Methanoregula sp.]
KSSRKGKPIKWIEKVEGSNGSDDYYLQNRNLLIQGLSDTLTISVNPTAQYSKLFDPSSDSIIFAKKKRPGMSASHSHSGTYIATDNNPVAVHAQASPCADKGDNWNLYRVNGNEAVVYSVAPKLTLKDVIDDCVQGCALNCYFVAALCSVAWMYYPSFPPLSNPSLKTPSGDYTITYHYASNSGTRDVKVSKELVLSIADTPVFSRPTPGNEIWNGLLEKAYSEFLVFSDSALPYKNLQPSNNEYADIEKYPRPNIPDDKGGNPIQALEHITGNTWKPYDPTNPADPQPGATCFATKDIPGGCFQRIIDNCKLSGVNNTLGKTNYPMVAYTYENGVKAGYDNNLYDSCILVANHSYSILGIKIDVVNGISQRYIILRNPYGKLFGAEPQPGNGFYLGLWSVPASGSCPALNNYNLATIDGIFGLRDDMFEKYFEAFGWVT